LEGGESGLIGFDGGAELVAEAGGESLQDVVFFRIGGNNGDGKGFLVGALGGERYIKVGV